MKRNSFKFLIAGASGQLAGAFKEFLRKENLPFLAPEEKELDITRREQIQQVIDTQRPSVILNCAAFNQVDAAEDTPEAAFRVNRDAAATLAKVCQEKGLFLVHFGTDYVFDGTKTIPYTEDDGPHPLGVYGQSKWEGEKAVAAGCRDYLIFRLSWVFGEGQNNFLARLSSWGQSKETLNVSSDETSSPTYTRDIVPVVINALERRLRGLYHLTNKGFCSRYELAKFFFEITRQKKTLIPVASGSFGLKARRPKFSALSHEKLASQLGVELPAWRDAVKRFLDTGYLT